jgi:hypothetical protein
VAVDVVLLRTASSLGSGPVRDDRLRTPTVKAMSAGPITATSTSAGNVGDQYDSAAVISAAGATLRWQRSVLTP